jgi:hypothetical protein
MSVADYDLVVIGGTAAAAATSASVRLPIVIRSTLIEGGVCSNAKENSQIGPLRHLNGPEGPRQRPHPPFGLPSNPEIGTIHVGSGFIH